MARRSRKHFTEVTEGAYRYVRAVPRPLRDLAGRTNWVRYFGVNYSRAAVEAECAKLDAEHDAEIRRMAALSPDERAAVHAAGGLRKIAAEAKIDARFNAETAPKLIRALEHVRPTSTEDQDDRYLGYEIDEAIEQLKKTGTERARLLGDASRGLAGLLRGAEAVQSAKGLQRARLYIARFTKVLGRDKAPGDVTQRDVVAWRNAMFDAGMTHSNQAQHLSKLSGLFAAAVDDGLIDANPFAGVKAKKRKTEGKVSDRKRAFTDAELRKFLKAAPTQGATFDLIARCLMLTGARSEDICELRVEDVRKVQGVWVFDVNDKRRTVKNAMSVRLVPIPKAVRAAIMARIKGRDGPSMVFEGVPERDTRGAHWYQVRASRIVRGHVTNDKTLTAHGLRHTWRQRAEALGVAPAVRRAIMGHALGKDAHDSVYGARPPVKELAKAIEKIADELEKSK